MQTRDRYPLDAVTGGCFVTRRYELAPGERVVDLDCDLEAFPMWGRLCVSELGVQMMMNALGWELPTENVMEANARLRAENKDLRTSNRRLREAIANVLDAAALAELAVIADEIPPVHDDEAVPA